MIEHTKEPWQTRTTESSSRFHIVESDYGFIADMNGLPDQSKANARRIVACVNACTGIPTETLEVMPTLHAHHRGPPGRIDLVEEA